MPWPEGRCPPSTNRDAQRIRTRQQPCKRRGREDAAVVGRRPDDAVHHGHDRGRRALGEAAVVIDEKHLVDVSARNLDEEGLFGMFNQECVDRLSSALSL